MNARCGPAFLPVREPGVLRLDRVELAPLQRGRLGMLDRVFDRPFAVRVTDPARISHDAVMREHRGVHRVQLRGVDVRSDHSLFEIIEDDVGGAAPEGPEGFLMQPRPGLLTRLPHHLAEALARVLQRHHEQVRAPVLARAHQRQRPLPVVDLRLFAGQELQHVETLGRACFEARHEALHRVVAVLEAVAFDQVLVDAHRVAAEPDLDLDPGAVWLAGRWARRRRGARGGARRRVRHRWPGWGNLLGHRAQAGGHCGGSGHRAGVGADGLAVDPGHALDFALRGASREQRLDGAA